ncbi:uncharacterized protein LOC111347166 isoform X2 [Stylophora pistillata]|uniref:uncharacterized protein LOC111347166 isoform X2 n=1 Tax=Stylophora pistillata TaxID=50429 RepID=UPI000C0474D0|nr:uncharacterized protein LOC111347166 isoform X2 [Stylophora pistillata]
MCFLVLLCLLCQLQARKGSSSHKTDTAVTTITNARRTSRPPSIIKRSFSRKTETSVTRSTNTQTTRTPPITIKGSFSPKTETSVTTSTNTRTASRPPSTLEGSCSPKTETSVTRSTNTQATRTPPLTIKGSFSPKTETSVTRFTNTQRTRTPPLTIKGNFSPKTETSVTTSTNARTASRPPSTIEGSSSTKTETSVTRSTNTQTTRTPPFTIKGSFSPKTETPVTTSTNTRTASRPPSTIEGSSSPRTETSVTTSTNTRTTGRPASTFQGSSVSNTKTSMTTSANTGTTSRPLSTIEDPCLKKPCTNGGSCNSRSEGFHCICHWGFSGNDCAIKGCRRPLGMQSGAIEDWQISARDHIYKPSPGRLLLDVARRDGDAWKPYWSYRGVWFQVYLHNEYTWVTGIATQGSVTTYFLRYWDHRGRWYKEKGQRYAKELTGNMDRNTVFLNKLETRIRTSFIRIYPWTWRMTIEIRMELYGCKDECLRYKPCKNGGTCVPDYINENYTCICPEEFYGDTCRLGNLCKLTKPCLNGGTCSPIRYWPYFQCNCSSPHIGFNCRARIDDPCSGPHNKPCKNGGTCTKQTNAVGYTCKCTSEYIGFDCSFLKDDPCFPNPCQNDGNCTRDDGQKNFICNCAFGYTGRKCRNLIVHGNWSHWTPWPNCNKPCNNGTRTRRRACDNPSPAFGGNQCEGLSSETEPCNQNKCPVEIVNYQVKLRGEQWEDSLADLGSEDYAKLVDRIKDAVNDLYYRRDENVTVDALNFRQGSVISSFNVTYQSIDSLQIVSLLEEIEEGKLGHIFAELLKITTRNVPEKAPEMLVAKSTTSTSIHLTWKNVAEHSAIKGYVILYKEVNKKFHTDTTKSVLPHQNSKVLEGLKMFKNYTIRVFAFTRSGNGVPSEAHNVRTQEDVPSEPPPDSVVKSTSSSTINVSWRPINPAFIHGILVGYEVRYAKDDDTPEWKNKIVDSDKDETVLSDLEYFTPYQVVICARTSKGCGKNVSHSATTFGDVPSKPPQNVTAEKLKAAESINVTWNEVPFSHVNGLLMGYSIKYRRVKTAEVNVVHSVEETAVAKSNDLWIVLTVQTYSVYAIRVAAFTQKGLGPYSEYEYGETCRCPKIIYTNYWSTPPYLKVNQEDNTMDGIFSHIVTDMIYTACGECLAYGSTEIDITSNGNKQPSAKESLVDVLGDIHDVPQISFPIYGNKYVTRFGGVHAYVNLVESPGLAFVAAKRIPGAAATNMINAVFSCFPLVILSACMSFISGFIIWLLDTKNNPGEFPTSFPKGVGEGFWWSFISMTTVGYGDRSPRSVPARMFGIAWTLTGLVIISILVGAIASALTSVTVKYPVILYGSKVSFDSKAITVFLYTLDNRLKGFAHLFYQPLETLRCLYTSCITRCSYCIANDLGTEIAPAAV